MKTLKSLLTACLLAGMAFGPKMAQAANYRDLALAEAAARSWWVYASSGSSVAAEIWYVGTATESVVTISSNTMYFYAPAGTLDTAVDTDGLIDLAATNRDTTGELCDYIDSLTNYGCNLLGSKRDDNTNRLLDQLATSGTNDLKAAGGFRVEFDTAPVSDAAVQPGAPGDDTDFDLRVWATPSSKDTRIVLKTCDWNINGTTNTDEVRVFGKSVDRSMEVHIPPLAVEATLNTETRVWREPITDDTLQTRDWTDNQGNGFMFAPGESVVVSGGNGTTVQATVANYLRCKFEER